jgi:hypothetical protein
VSETLKPVLSHNTPSNDAQSFLSQSRFSLPSAVPSYILFFFGWLVVPLSVFLFGFFALVLLCLLIIERTLDSSSVG